MSSQGTKQKLLDQCQNYVNQRLQRIQNIIMDIQESLASETKSTAGDKHETGRAMLQLEREKAGQQLAEAQKLKEIIHKIDISVSSGLVRIGSLVITTQGNYFLSISAGKIIIDNQIYYAIAPNTPLGKLLLGKSSEDSIQFRGASIHIRSIL